MPFPDYQLEHSTYDGAVAEAKRVLAVLPRFREENAQMEDWLTVSFPEEPDRAIVYPDPFDCSRFGMDLEHASVVIMDGEESA